MRVCFKNIIMVITVVILLGIFSLTVSASSVDTEVAGKIYEFDKKSHYEFLLDAAYQDTGSVDTYGTFYIRGNVGKVGEKSGVPSYEALDGSLDICYEYDDEKLNAGDDEWHLVDDKSKKVADMSLDSNIMKGAIIVQTSKDRMNWVGVETICNAFSDIPIRTDPIMHPENHNIRAKIRQQLQILRSKGFIQFLGNGSCRKV